MIPPSSSKTWIVKSNPSFLPYRRLVAVSDGGCTAPRLAHKWKSVPSSHCPIPTACLLLVLSSLQGPHSDHTHMTFHTGTLRQQERSCSPLVLAQEDAGPLLPVPLYLARELTARLRGVLCMNCFYRVCLDQQSKRNSTSSDRTRLR